MPLLLLRALTPSAPPWEGARSPGALGRIGHIAEWPLAEASSSFRFLSKRFIGGTLLALLARRARGAHVGPVLATANPAVPATQELPAPTTAAQHEHGGSILAVLSAAALRLEALLSEQEEAWLTGGAHAHQGPHDRCRHRAHHRHAPAAAQQRPPRDEQAPRLSGHAQRGDAGDAAGPSADRASACWGAAAAAAEDDGNDGRAADAGDHDAAGAAGLLPWAAGDLHLRMCLLELASWVLVSAAGVGFAHLQVQVSDGSPVATSAAWMQRAQRAARPIVSLARHARCARMLWAPQAWVGEAAAPAARGPGGLRPDAAAARDVQHLLFLVGSAALACLCAVPLVLTPLATAALLQRGARVLIDFSLHRATPQAAQSHLGATPPVGAFPAASCLRACRREGPRRSAIQALGGRGHGRDGGQGVRGRRRHVEVRGDASNPSHVVSSAGIAPALSERAGHAHAARVCRARLQRQARPCLPCRRRVPRRVGKAALLLLLVGGATPPPAAVHCALCAGLLLTGGGVVVAGSPTSLRLVVVAKRGLAKVRACAGSCICLDASVRGRSPTTRRN